MRLEDLIWPYLRERVRRGELTVGTARNHMTALNELAASFGDRQVGRLARRDIERWMESAAEYAPGTRRNRFSVVRGFCRWLVARGYVRRDPCAEIRAPRPARSVPKALPFDAVAACLDVAADQRSRVVAVLMVQQGLRRMEVAGLELGDIDLNYGTMRIVGKGGHERMLPITDETRRELSRYLAEHPASNGPLIRSYTHPNRGMSPNWIGRLIRQMQEDAGVKVRAGDGVGPHSFRHTCLTDMLRGGAHVRDVQAAAGHKHLQTTETYLPLLVGTLGDAMGGRSYASFEHVAPEQDEAVAL